MAGIYLAGQEVLSAELNGSIEQGWSWSVQLHGRNSPTFATDSQTFVLQVDGGVGGGSSSSPPLVASDNREDWDGMDGPGSSWSGMDQATWKAGRDGQSFASYRSKSGSTVSSTQILSDLAARAGVSVTGMLDWTVPSEDIKQSKLLDAMARFARAVGYSWRVTKNGQIQFFPWGQGAVRATSCRPAGSDG